MTADIPYTSQYVTTQSFVSRAKFNVSKGKSVGRSFLERIEKNIIEVVASNELCINYEFKDVIDLQIPVELSYLRTAYEKSQYILELENDWDENGALSYKLETWIKSINFIHEFSLIIFRDFKRKIISPKIYHGPSQSIDILLENNKYSLLINIPPDSDLGIYYGKDKVGNSSKGEINLNKINYALIPIAFNF